MDIFAVTKGVMKNVRLLRFTFPDGQRHVELEGLPGRTTVFVTADIMNSDDLFDLALVMDVLKSRECRVELYITYLLGARMDRAVSLTQPFTSKVVGQVISNMRADRIQVLDPHSDEAVRHIKPRPEVVLPTKDLRSVLSRRENPVVVIPDKGATARVKAMVSQDYPTLQCYKERNVETGELSGFRVDGNPHRLKKDAIYVIVDDICDGGGTFVGLANLLRTKGASRVDLYVTHGLFTKGLTPLYEKLDWVGCYHDLSAKTHAAAQM